MQSFVCVSSHNQNVYTVTLVYKVFTINLLINGFFSIFLVGCRWVSEYSGGCWNTSEVEPFNCTSDDTTSLYKKVKNALWCTEIRPVQQPWDILNVKLGLTIAGIHDVVSISYVFFNSATVIYFLWRNFLCVLFFQNEKDQVIILSIVTTLVSFISFCLCQCSIPHLYFNICLNSDRTGKCHFWSGIMLHVELIKSHIQNLSCGCRIYK